MYRIDNSTASTTMPTVAAPGPRPNGFFTVGNPITPTPATVVDQDWLNTIQEELAAVVLAGSLTLNKSTRTQIRDAINALIAAYINFPDPATAGLIITGATTTGANLRLVGNGSTTPNKTIRARSGALEILNSAYSAVIASLSDLGDLGIRNLAASAGTFSGAITAAVGTGFSHRAIFATPGSQFWTVPTGVTRCFAQAWGGGGAGGASGPAATNCGGGGGGGGYSDRIFTGLVGGTNISLLVGAGGVCPNNASGGQAGGTSNFNGGVIVAEGGSGGARYTAGNLLAAGGPGIGGDWNMNGGQSVTMTSFANFNAGNNYGGAGGDGANGGTGASGTNGIGGAGNFPGGGGSGAGDLSGAQIGGPGANGAVVVWY